MSLRYLFMRYTGHEMICGLFVELTDAKRISWRYEYIRHFVGSRNDCMKIGYGAGIVKRPIDIDDFKFSSTK
jgi:hypothetical protein